jgi:hypothetical protein
MKGQTLADYFFLLSKTLTAFPSAFGIDPGSTSFTTGVTNTSSRMR